MRSRKISNWIIAITCLGLLFSRAGVSYASKDGKAKDLPIEATASADKAVIQIGDKITYTVTVKAQRDTDVEFPQLMPQDLAGFAIKDFGSSVKGLFGKKDFKQWYLLDTYVSGAHTISAVTVKYRSKGSKGWKDIKVKEVKVEVKGVLDKASGETDIRDIRGPKGFASKIWLYVMGVLISFLIIGLVAALVLLKKKRDQESAPPVPAHITAYEALSALKKKDYISNGQTKAYYIELSDIVRHYIENRFAIRAPEMTTEEFLVRVKEESALSLEHKGLLRDFLSNCDMVKFAKYKPAQTEAQMSFASAKRLIDQTKQEEAPK